MRQHLERAGNACMDAPTAAHFDFGNRPPVVGFHAELKRWVRLPTFFSHSKQTYLVAATKGLYVYNVNTLDDKEETWREGDDRRKLYKRSQLVVTNPWTGATKWHPLMLNERGPFDSFVAYQACVFTLDVVDNGRAYIITGINAWKFRGEVYDSRLGYWTAFNAPLDSASVNMPFGSNGRRVQLMRRCVRFMGSLYFVANDEGQSVRGSRYIISFDLENQKWTLVYDMLVAAPERFSDGMRAKLGDREYEPWLITTCDIELVVVDMWRTRTGFGGQILTLDVEPRTLVRRKALF